MLINQTKRDLRILSDSVRVNIIFGMRFVGIFEISLEFLIPKRLEFFRDLLDRDFLGSPRFVFYGLPEIVFFQIPRISGFFIKWDLPKSFFLRFQNRSNQVLRDRPMTNFERFWYSRTFLKKIIKVQNQAEKFNRVSIKYCF